MTLIKMVLSSKPAKQMKGRNIMFKLQYCMQIKWEMTKLWWSLNEISKHIRGVIHDHVINVQRFILNSWWSRGVAWSSSMWNLVRSARLHLEGGEVCFKLLIILCTIHGLHVEIHQMFRGPTLLCHMIITTTLVTSGFVVLVIFRLRNVFSLLEFATWLASSLELAFASWTSRLDVPILIRFLNVRMYLRQRRSSHRALLRVPDGYHMVLLCLTQCQNQ